MLWIIVLCGFAVELYFGVKLFYEVVMYIVNKLWYKTEYIFPGDGWHHISYHSIVFDAKALKSFATASSICILIVLCILLLIHLEKFEEETTKTKTLCKIRKPYYVISNEYNNTYSFGYLMKDGAYYQKEVDTQDVYIYFKNGIPHVEEHKKYIRYKNPNIMFVLLFSRKKLLDHYYEITVPKGSILKTF